jgi:hypothetical protein
LNLLKADQVQATLNLEVVPDDLSYDTSTSDNVSTKSVTIKGVELEENLPVAAASVKLLETTGDIGKNVTMPGEFLNLRAYLAGGEGKYTRVLFYVDGKMVANQQCYMPKSGEGTVSTFNYFVPWTVRALWMCEPSSKTEIPRRFLFRWSLRFSGPQSGNNLGELGHRCGRHGKNQMQGFQGQQHSFQPNQR